MSTIEYVIVCPVLYVNVASGAEMGNNIGSLL